MTSGPAGACCGGGRDKGEAEQALLDKALKDYPRVFTPRRLWTMDRNFPGVSRIARMLATGTHVLIRVKDGITLDRIGDFLPDGSYLARISGGGITLIVRVIEYTVAVAGRDAPELFCLITDLHDHDAYPARTLAAAYHWRWIGSETSLKEAKSAISGAGPSTGPMLRSQSPALAAQEHAAWVIAVELARATARAAAAIAVPAGKGKHAGQPVHPRQISFTSARPRDHRHHQGLDGHRQPARLGGRRQLRPRPGLPGPPPRRMTATGTATARPRPGWQPGRPIVRFIPGISGWPAVPRSLACRAATYPPLYGRFACSGLRQALQPGR